ncbi:nitrate reductase molybdenum cofactor assembly chaperone [Actinosynnema sp. ALI-1.44]|uniref:nitrate reductase molybdenum cofactor assembly chaperone n=1 Tax=Actinosynnema sp. ALI-1.44 TaxID=1933779 RepID=UPI00097C3D0B|nr:nitrate reductase molybdenum cofactor assembly chaperone [Actinosynnema sp. ALI-1.44]ONI75148.1 nitrate reductase molybdenum cofactor assembly chaperone [Actinosynnema sp. ALI-1.44]
MSRAVNVLQQVASHCLHYPDEQLYQRIPLLRRCVAEIGAKHAGGIASVLDHFERTSPVDAARHYVDVFDTKPGRCLYMTWYTDGDTRRRGGSLAAMKSTYRQHGFRLADGELPDYLPILLEFAALTGEPGRQALARFRQGLDLLHTKLSKIDTPYTAVVGAVIATVPHAVDVLPADPMPRAEQVGLEPVLLGYPTTRPLEATR